MKKNLTLLLIGCFALFIGTSAKAPTLMEENASKIIKIKNTTNFVIDEIYLSPVDEATWEEDILDPDEVLMPGEVIQVEIDCGTWDVKLVAEDGSTCEIESVKICAYAQWNIVADCN